MLSPTRSALKEPGPSATATAATSPIARSVSASRPSIAARTVRLPRRRPARLARPAGRRRRAPVPPGRSTSRSPAAGREAWRRQAVRGSQCAVRGLAVGPRFACLSSDPAGSPPLRTALCEPLLRLWAAAEQLVPQRRRPILMAGRPGPWARIVSRRFVSLSGASSISSAVAGSAAGAICATRRPRRHPARRGNRPGRASRSRPPPAGRDRRGTGSAADHQNRGRDTR